MECAGQVFNAKNERELRKGGVGDVNDFMLFFESFNLLPIKA